MLSVLSPHILGFLCTTYYWLITAVALMAYTFRWMRPILSYGRLSGKPASGDSAAVIASTNNIWLPIDPRRLWLRSVPKYWFWHFYTVGSIWNAVLLFWAFRQRVVVPHVAIIRLAMMQVHLGRRLAECLWVQKPSPTATMLVGHYLLGISFYLVTCLSLALPPGDSQQPLTSTPSLTAVTPLSIVVFLWANWQQYKSHQQLASLRSANSSIYRLPTGGWFDLLLMPHYSFEILIYSTLLSVSGGGGGAASIIISQSPLLWCLVWCLVNLSITASQSRQWYEQTLLRRSEPKSLRLLRKRWTIIPLLY